MPFAQFSEERKNEMKNTIETCIGSLKWYLLKEGNEDKFFMVNKKKVGDEVFIEVQTDLKSFL